MEKMKFRKYICKDGLSVDVGIVNLIQNVEKHIVRETRGVKISEGNPLVLEILVTIRQSNEKENKQ